MATNQTFQFITLRGKIQKFKPYNPFAEGIIETINTYPTSQQAALLNQALINSQVHGLIIVEGINADYDAVLYTLTISTP